MPDRICVKICTTLLHSSIYAISSELAHSWCLGAVWFYILTE